ncbi:MAG: LysM peptidoglycan-binding domain-containing M23 family metallopeptidase [Aminipila sp.]
MAKFFKEDLNKLKNKEAKSKPGGLIKDLDSLGKSKEDSFLKGFPKTPAEIAAEEEEVRAKEEAAKRAEKELAKKQEEENKAVIEQAEREAVHQKKTKSQVERDAVKAAKMLKSGDVKSTKEFLETHKFSLHDVILLIEKGIADFATESLNTLSKLIFCFGAEFLVLVESVVSLFKKISFFITHKVNIYYTLNPEKRVIRRQKNRKLMRQFIQTKNNFIAREKALATKMVGFINHVDNKNEQLADKTNVMVKEGNRKFNFAREWAEINKKKLLLQFGMLIVIAICGVSIFNYCTAYEYAYNGRTLGIVEKQEDVLKLLDIVSVQLSKEHNAEISIDKTKDITFKRVSSLNKDIDDTEEVLKRLTYMRNMSARAYGIYVNDVRVAIVDSKETGQAILKNITETFLPDVDSVTYEDIGFKEKIDIKQIDTKLGRIQNIDVATQKLMTGAVYQQVHKVVAGETLSGIAKLYNMTISDLKAANPSINPERLSIGQEITLTKPAPMVTIKTVEIATYREAIPYTTEYQDTDNLYKGETTTKVKGANGERSVTARITRENGIQVLSTELSSEVIAQPTTEVVKRGTKELPPLQGTGNLRYPVSGYRLTSKFGTRWGRMHNGLDLACPTGTRIGAADGGTVVFSGYSGSYGYVVKISHGGGIVTVYAHCSKLFVKKGDKVYQGQHIANVGNTGRSTGPHCHFEVQKNGVPRNPLDYL